MQFATCPYCHGPLVKRSTITSTPYTGAIDEWRPSTWDNCGWWKIAHYFDDSEGARSILYRSGAAGILERLSLTNIEIPMEKARRFMLSKYDARIDAGSIRFEKLVASVFENFGCCTTE